MTPGETILRESWEMLGKIGGLGPTITVDIRSDGTRVVLEGPCKDAEAAPVERPPASDLMPPQDWPAHLLLISPACQALLNAATDQYQSAAEIGRNAKLSGLLANDNDVPALLRDLVARGFLESTPGRGIRLRQLPDGQSSQPV